ncbi:MULTISPECIES: hypothetical protein [Streptococcus]|uniref:hypothetical protein n=1 Tax=Streptococcus TaxID=1301 RepID=UPI001F035D7A|nr:MULTISPECIES: hypothetical protein [Streptococcus]
MNTHCMKATPLLPWGRLRKSAKKSKETGIAERMLKYYTFASTQRRNPNGRAVVKIEVDDEG